MIKKLSLLKLLAIPLILLSPSVVESADLDKYKTSQTDSPYYASALFKTYAQKTEEQEEILFTVTSVSINNEIVDISENNEIYATKDDAVRIAGKAQPTSKITVYYADKKIDINVRDNGDWFVLFSVTNMNDSRYAVTIKLDDTKQTTPLVTLVIGTGKKTIQPVLDVGISQGDSFLENRGKYITFLSVLLFSTALGWFLGSYTERRKITKRKRK